MKRYGRWGIQATQLTLLNAIVLCDQASEAEGAAMSDLAEVLAMDLTTLSRNLRPLEKSRLIAVSQLPTDRRVRRLWGGPVGMVYRQVAGRRATVDAKLSAFSSQLSAFSLQLSPFSPNPSSAAR